MAGLLQIFAISGRNYGKCLAQMFDKIFFLAEKRVKIFPFSHVSFSFIFYTLRSYKATKS